MHRTIDLLTLLPCFEISRYKLNWNHEFKCNNFVFLAPGDSSIQLCVFVPVNNKIMHRK